MKFLDEEEYNDAELIKKTNKFWKTINLSHDHNKNSKIKKNDVSLIKVNKISLSTGDDKRIETFSYIETFTYGTSKKLI